MFLVKHLRKHFWDWERKKERKVELKIEIFFELVARPRNKNSSWEDKTQFAQPSCLFAIWQNIFNQKAKNLKISENRFRHSTCLSEGVKLWVLSEFSESKKLFDVSNDGGGNLDIDISDAVRLYERLGFGQIASHR